METLKRFMFYRMLFGYFYDFRSTKLVNVYKGIYCASFVLVTSVCVCYNMTFNITNSVVYTLAEFYFLIIKSFLFENKIEKYFYKILKLDKMFRIEHRIISLKMYFIFIFVFILQLVVFLLNSDKSYFIFLISLSISISYIPEIIVFDVLYSRINILRLIIQCIYCINFQRREKIFYKIFCVKKCIIYYKELSNNINCIEKELNVTLLISIIVNYPETLFQFWNFMLHFLQNDWTLYDALSAFCPAVIVILTLTITAMLANSICQECKKITNILLDQYISCQDKMLQLELHRALCYLTYRPFQFCIIRAIPLSIKIPISFISVCISHIIVAIQFRYFKT
ncbi:uncharacterized protein LOC123689296 [Pieris rapae]|uniref:uncharacterized protein LOC123689296 n=1 Tax=Pieris rapae TaxID=64459 RepID=UPI001E27DF06|nr:uncharacterized protein LOC123689296 [Pieris rapae]